MDNTKFKVGNSTIVLSETERLLLKLNYCDQLDSMQIANVLEISENEVKKTLIIIKSRFKDNIKLTMEDMQNEESQEFFIQLNERYSIDEEKALIIFNGVCAELYGNVFVSRINKAGGRNLI